MQLTISPRYTFLTFLDFLLPWISLADSSSYCWDALGLSPWASSFLCSHALVISFSLMAAKPSISRWLRSPTWTFHLNSRLIYPTTHWTSPCGCLIDTSNLPCPKWNLWSSHKPALLTVIQSQWTKGGKFHFSPLQRCKTLKSVLTLLFPSPPTCNLSGSPIYSIFKIHSEFDFSPPPPFPPCLEPPPFFTYVVAIATYLACLLSFLPYYSLFSTELPEWFC